MLPSDLEQSLNALCNDAVRLSDDTINKGGCAGFAAVVAAAMLSAAPYASASCIVCLPIWEDPHTWKMRWVRSGNAVNVLQVWHVVCMIEFGDDAYVVDANAGVVTFDKYAKDFEWYNIVTDTPIEPSTMWKAYKVRDLWNREFRRTSMRAIRAEARKRFGRINLPA